MSKKVFYHNLLGCNKTTREPAAQADKTLF